MWGIVCGLVIIVSLVFHIIHWVHKKIGHHKTKQHGYWEISFQTIESMFEYRMIHFFAPNISSARILRFWFLVFVTYFVWAYNCNLRSALLAGETDKPLRTLQVMPYVPTTDLATINSTGRGIKFVGFFFSI